ncbi:MAG: hypothetical protein HUJ54_15105, partial [Erysipelotrichaceae bacterium]|nr:hypothetical protein [Erysipelotrichaceae bacterium]
SSLLNANTALFDTEEIFYLKPDWDKVYHAIMTANYQGSITSMNKQDGAHAVNFESPYFTARFSEKQNEGPLHCYKFRYTGEKNMNSLTAAGNALSNLVTAIETTLSSLDPTATVIRQNR